MYDKSRTASFVEAKLRGRILHIVCHRYVTACTERITISTSSSIPANIYMSAALHPAARPLEPSTVLRTSRAALWPKMVVIQQLCEGKQAFSIFGIKVRAPTRGSPLPNITGFMHLT